MMDSIQLLDLPEQRDARGPFITTRSGTRFFIQECNVQDILLDDVAHSLSMQCRFNGHIDRHYSVAEHCILVSTLVEYRTKDPELAFWGLIHDLSEAFVPDVPSPFKRLLRGFEELEQRILTAYAFHFNLSSPYVPVEVNEVDKKVAAVEARALFKKPPLWVEDYGDPICHTDMIKAWEPATAAKLFMNRLHCLRYYMETEKNADTQG